MKKGGLKIITTIEIKKYKNGNLFSDATTYTEASTLITKENPLQPHQDISVNTLLTLKAVDQNHQTCIINHEILMELTKFKEMIKV